jgi:hypothetical protein
MLFGLEEPELQDFADRIAATAIVNQAVLKCAIHGIPVTPDNVIFVIGDFVDPARLGFEGLMSAILRAIDEIGVKPELPSSII